MNPEESFGRLIKARRRALDLTQEELARRVGCAAVTLRKIEADDLRPSQQIAERMAMALGIPLEERAAFVRQARAVTPKTGRMIEPTPTPMPWPEEIGQEDLSGRAIRGYALGERIGNGGMGAVYRAVQPLVEREVAIKIILPQFANHPDFIRRFEAEAQLVARLEHPHIVPLYDYWREPGVAYLVMRLLRGGSVRTLLESGALPLEAVARLLEQIGAALHAAHRVGVIHRDLKPANVLLDEDSNAYLADFGIAKNLGNPNLEDVTHADAIVGSPAYMSPEQIRSDTIRPQTDIYCLGVMLYELLTGNAPFHGPTPFDLIQQHLSTPLPPLAARRPGLPAALDTVIMRATAKDPAERYPDVESLLSDLRIAMGSVKGGGLETRELGTSLQSSNSPILTADDNPYKGLRAFGEGDAEDFFGRETLTQQLLARLAEGGDLARFLAVVGPSGSGKSSVVGAGFVPALRRGALPGSENWFIVELMPGPHPLEELEAALLRVAVNPVGTQYIASLLAQLKEDERGLLRAVRRCLPDDSNIELVLVIDQFEEVFTLVQDEAVRAHLLNSLLAAVLDEQSRVRVIITLRADFTDRPLRYMDFGELMRQRSEFVLPLTPDELEHAIRNPATRVGLTLEPGLAAAIIHDVADQPGALPLLQYALTELFEKREGRTLTKKAYTEIGGVLGALGRRAEEVFASLGADGQALARQLFLRLVTLGEGVEDTRRRVLRAELESLAGLTPIPSPSPVSGEGSGDSPSPDRVIRSGEGVGGWGIARVLESFGKHRLLSFDRDPVTRGPTVEVAHEALLREWPRLREWLNESRADVRLQRQLGLAAAEWQSANRDVSFLLTGARLGQFEGWVANTTIALTRAEQVYLDAGIAERATQETAEQIRQKRELDDAKHIAEAARKLAETERQSATRLRLRNRVITAVGAVAVVLAVLTGLFGLQSNQNANAARANAATAQADFTRAEAQRLAAEANSLMHLGGDPQLSALLSLRSLNIMYSPQGDTALSGAAALAMPRQQFVGHTDQVWAVAFSPDGRYALTGGWDETARLWDAQTGQELRSFTGHHAQIEGVAFSPDGKYILTGSQDQTARLWDAQTGEQLQTFTGHNSGVTRVSFSLDGNYVLTGSHDRTARLWDAQTGKELQRFVGHTAEIRGIAFSPDGHYVLTGSDDKTARLWDVQTGQEVRRFADEFTDVVHSVAFSPDGEHALTSSWDKTARLWDVQTGREIRRFIGHANNVESVAFSPDGKYVATGSWDQTARIWDAQTGQQLHVFTGHTDWVESIAFSPDGRYLLAGSNRKVLLWETDGGTEVPQFTGHTSGVNGIAFSYDGKYIVTGSTDNTARLWDAQSGQQLHIFVGHSDWLNNGVAFSPDGKYVLTGSFDDTARLWDARTGQQLHIFSGHSNSVNGVAFSPAGKYVVTASYDKTARLWDVQTGQIATIFYGHSDSIYGVAFSPDGKYVFTGSWDNTARLWDTQTGKELQHFTGHTDYVNGVAFSPNGKYVATASNDKTARLWDVQTGEELQRFSGHTSLIWSVVFSPDGKFIATASDDGTARLWTVDYHDTIRYLCSVLLRDFTDDERAQYNIPNAGPTCPQP